jgi:2-hydroxychromene-2-carboxylate isomerase
MKNVTWYFDFLSPFAYLQCGKLPVLPRDLQVTIKPVLFPALLNHWGNSGPAEISSKRRFVYRFVNWHADRRGMPFKIPPIHPFDPLPPLRLAILANSEWRAVMIIFEFLYARGINIEGEEAIAEVGSALGIQDAFGRISAPEVKLALKENTEEAIQNGVFGVPTFVMNGDLFWGDDAIEMFLDYVYNPDIFNEPEMLRISNLPMGHERPQMGRSRGP